MTTPDIENPFFKPFTESEAIPFSRIDTSHFLPAIRRGIDLQLKEYDAIASSPEEPTVENTLMALEYSGADLTRVLEVFYPMTSAMLTDELMAIDEEVTPLLTTHSLALWQNEKIWQRIKSLYDRRESLRLDTPTLRLLTDYYEAFVSGGAMLEATDKARFKELAHKLSDLSRRYGENVVKEMRGMKLTGASRDELAGIPDNILASVEDMPDGSWTLAISQPVYMEVMRTASNRDLRHRLYLLYSRRNAAGPYSNLDIAAEIARLRMELALLLGYPTAAHKAVRRRMAGTPERVMALLTDLRDSYRTALGREMAEMEQWAGYQIQPWDYAYQARLLKANAYAFDEDAMKPYLELGNVLKGVMAMAGILYGVTMTEITGSVDTYHPEVRVWRVEHPDRGFLGLLYLDFFARPTKQPGAWMTEFRGQMRMPDGADLRPYVTLVTNFTPPADGPTDDEPVLLRPREAETLLHETGHALHALLSDCRYPGQAGTNVKRDFVELPSQLNEAFLTRKEFLDVAARHYLTGDPVPTGMVDAMRKSASFGAAYQCFRQLGFGLVDMAWHSIASAAEADMAAADPIAFERRAMESVKVFDEPDGCATSAAFTHIFSGGYAAGYYSYKWAEVLAADAFEAIGGKPGSNDDLDLEAARRFADFVLSRGDTDDPAGLYRLFRGRDADPAALLRRDFPEEE